MRPFLCSAARPRAGRRPRSKRAGGAGSPRPPRWPSCWPSSWARWPGEFPNYLAYFNGLVAPADGYRHLVDSSSDWGQELPALRHTSRATPVPGPRYLAYFGSDSPAYFHIPAELTNCVLPILDPSAPPLLRADLRPRPAPTEGVRGSTEAQHPEFDALGAIHEIPGETSRAVFLRQARFLRLSGGTYFISSTILEAVKFGSVRPWETPWGPWNSRYEKTYQRLRPLVQPFLDEDPAVRAAAVAHATPAELWASLLNVLEYDEFRFARLKAYLRHRAPDGNVNFAILIYRLTDAEVAQALGGPPPELGPDVAALSGAAPIRR